MPYVRPTRRGQFGRWIAAIGLLGATPVLAVIAWQMYHRAAATAAWPTVQGVITRCGLRDLGYRDGAQRFAVDIGYVYRVGDRDYTGTRVRIADPHERLDAAKAAIADLRTGQGRAVYYDPADPSQSLLKPGAISGEAWMFILPVFTFAGGMAILVWLIRNRGKEFVRLEPYV